MFVREASRLFFGGFTMEDDEFEAMMLADEQEQMMEMDNYLDEEEEMMREMEGLQQQRTLRCLPPFQYC